MDPEPAPILPGATVELPNGERAVVGLLSGLSALVRIGNCSAWYEQRQLKVVEP